MKPELIAGYPRLAGQISRHAQYGIYRSFAALNAQNLLYMQAEIHELEDELRRTEKADSLCTDDIRPNICGNWTFLDLSKNEADACKQYNLFMRIRALLPKFCM
jgi:hypothetical protein